MKLVPLFQLRSAGKVEAPAVVAMALEVYHANHAYAADGSGHRASRGIGRGIALKVKALMAP